MDFELKRKATLARLKELQHERAKEKRKRGIGKRKVQTPAVPNEQSEGDAPKKIVVIFGSQSRFIEGLVAALKSSYRAQHFADTEPASAFIELNDRLIYAYYKGLKHDTWNGFNLLAWDGSTLRLPDEKPIVEHFGTWKTKTDPCPISRVSQMFDVLNKITVDAIISPKAVGERELAARHCLKLMPNDLVLMDRGYPAYWLFNLIMALGASFCARISTKWKIVRQFEKSGAPERIVKLKPTPVSVKQCRQMGLDINPLKLRLIRVELDAGKVETLITSLLETTEFHSDLFGDLYHLRWPVEEDYKVIKNRITVENFSGKSVLSVYQDFHAKVFSKNIAAVISRTIKPAVENRYSNLKYGYQVNFARALSKLKSTIVMLFNRSLQEVKKILKIIEKSLLKTVEQVRPGRKFKRNHRIKLKKFFPAYQPIC